MEMEAFVYVYDHFVQSAVESNVNLSVQSILLDIVYNGSCAGRSEDLQLALIKLWLLPIIRYECKVRGDYVHALVDSVWEIVRDELMAVKDQLTLKNSVNKVVYDCIRHLSHAARLGLIKLTVVDWMFQNYDYLINKEYQFI
ncbi:hypothetical protein MP228_003917 [Amoeboaphelidium protococcarum]|nr:hypothetical protein MP228_003917 [Amoeboaphelidium protococcarum]